MRSGGLLVQNLIISYARALAPAPAGAQLPLGSAACVRVHLDARRPAHAAWMLTAPPRPEPRPAPGMQMAASAAAMMVMMASSCRATGSRGWSRGWSSRCMSALQHPGGRAR